MRNRIVVGLAGAAALLVAATARDASACGGCFHEPSESGTVITDHRMIFSLTPEQTTLYDEIEYQGSPQNFAWVLPIHGTVTIGLSSDVVFATLEQFTQTHIVPPNLPPCPQAPSCDCGGDHATPGYNGAGGSSGGSSGGGVDAGVTVEGQQTVGPYDTVQLHSSDPNALDAWLTANNFVIPDDVKPIIAAYVNEGFDFLALRLAPGQGVSAMRPVRVTAPGAGLSLPLRMVSAGAGAQVGITLWVVGQGRYEPMNFPDFTIDPGSITWDFALQDSDYSTIRQAKEQAGNYAAWQIESSLDLSPYQIENLVLAAPADQNYTAVDAPDGGGVLETADQVRTADMAALFGTKDQSQVRITRMRADLAHAALANDLALQAASDQSPLSNVYQVTDYVHAPTCPAVPPMSTCPPCPNLPYGYGGSATAGKTGDSFGCATAADGGTGGSGLEVLAIGAACAVILRIRSRGKKK